MRPLSSVTKMNRNYDREGEAMLSSDMLRPGLSGQNSNPAFSVWQEQGSVRMRSMNSHGQKKLSISSKARKSWDGHYIRHSASHDKWTNLPFTAVLCPWGGRLEQVSSGPLD